MALNKEQIIEEALQLLNADGLEGLTLRKLAKRLDVQAPALYWHFKNKNVLITDMADAMLRMEFPEMPPRKKEETWQDWLMQVFIRLRNALLSYTDGGRVVAGAHLATAMANISEEMMKTLLEAGVNLRQSRLIVLTATRFTFGHVMEEQTTVTEKEMQAFHFDPLHQEYPTLAAGIEEYFSEGKTVDDLFIDGLKLIIR